MDKYGINITVNKCDPDIYIPHYRGGIYSNCTSMDVNCIISSGCVLGNKTGGSNGPNIGNNVEISIGGKVIG